MLWRNRPAAVLAGLGILSFAAWAVTVAGPPSSGAAIAAAASAPFVIEVNEQGFNPQVCVVNRGSQTTQGDQVLFRNVGTQNHHIVVPDVGAGNPPRYDFGDLAPGQETAPLQFDLQTILNYIDVNNPALKGRIESGSGASNCMKQAPTPTPTPTRTATPVPTPTPWVIQSAKCRPGLGCAVTQQLAKDD